MNDSLYFDLLNENLFNIYDGEINFDIKNDKISTHGNIIFQTSPYPEIIMTSHEPFTINCEIDEFLINNEIQTLNNHQLSVHGSEAYRQDEQSNTIQGYKFILETIKMDDNEVDEVVIFIMNCSHIGLTYLEVEDYQFEYEDWLINFKFRPDKEIKTHYDNLRKNREYEITHVGIISKKDNKSFNTNEITEIISNIEWYLSFCSAQSVFIPIQIGFKKESKVWENYVIKNMSVTHFQDNHGWVPLGAVEDFNNFFPKVATQLGQELWSDVLKVVLNWYLEIKNNGMIENKIISTQVALEQLAWAYLVNQEQMLDKEAYKKLRASDILRLFCYQLKISREIIAEDANEFVKKYNNDGVFMFVDFRNNLVHPEKKMNSNQSDIDFQYTVYLQGLYFLEMALTRICGYKGEYEKS